MTKLLKTPINAAHLQAGAKMVDFGGWEMPLHYGSQVEEHHTIRNHAGMFDVSHMVVSDLIGTGAADYLSKLLANDIARINNSNALIGKALYSCMLNEEGGVIDDLIVYWMGGDRYRIVTNAATRENDLSWMNSVLEGFDATLTEQSKVAMVAVQGPEARELVIAWGADKLGAEVGKDIKSLERFFATEYDGWFIGRTGYTGEDGFEVMMVEDKATLFWEEMLIAGVKPCGLGARDTLRLEAGMMLYGSDLDAVTTPLESALSWSVGLDPAERRFIGRELLDEQKERGVNRKLVGVLLDGRGVMRDHQKLLFGGEQVGEITSGGFSPTLNRTIALARIRADVTENCEVEMRGKMVPVIIQRPLFVRNGQPI